MTDRPDPMQRFYETQNRARRPYFVSKVVDARLHLSGYAVLPWVFAYTAFAPSRPARPVELVILAVPGFWGVLCVQYLPRSAPEGLGALEVFRRSLAVAGVRNPQRWAFLWHVAMGVIAASCVGVWFR